MNVPLSCSHRTASGETIDNYPSDSVLYSSPSRDIPSRSGVTSLTCRGPSHTARGKNLLTGCKMVLLYVRARCFAREGGHVSKRVVAVQS